MPVGTPPQTESQTLAPAPPVDSLVVRKPWCAMLLSISSDLSGVTALEYGLIAALIAVVIITAVATLGSNLGVTFSALANHFTGGTVN